INVGGKRKIKMDDLKALFAQLNYQDIATYIQSGNVLFSTPKELDIPEEAKKIEGAILDQFTFEVPVIIRKSRDLESIIKGNPFLEKGKAIETLHLTFLSKIPSEEKREKIKSYDYAPDLFQIQGQEVYIYCEGKYHQTKLNNQFFEKKLGVSASTRNWKTLLKLKELAKNE
ncbi:MAG: DUF1697 domain-containing protein, partial [Bacteroidota bacterium]